MKKIINHIPTETMESIATAPVPEEVIKNISTSAEVAPIKRLTKYTKQSAIVNVSKNDIKFVIQSYYQIQKYRISLAGQIRSINASNEEEKNHELLDWLFSNMVQLEAEIKKAVEAYVQTTTVGQWLMKITGIGPILAGGLLTYFDPARAPSVSHFYSYAGLNDNNVPWLGKEESKKLVNQYISKDVTDEELMALSEATNRSYEKLLKMSLNDKGKRSKTQLTKNLAKPPYNTDLKKLCWKVGESFVKVSNKDTSLYGRIYRERKMLEEKRNENLEFKDQAEHILATTNIGTETDAYKWYSQGMLPPNHLNARAKRYAVKIFVSHLYDEMYKDHFHKQPVRAYVFEHLGHVDVIEPEVPSMINLGKE